MHISVAEWHLACSNRNNRDATDSFKKDNVLICMLKIWLCPPNPGTSIHCAICRWVNKQCRIHLSGSWPFGLTEVNSRSILKYHRVRLKTKAREKQQQKQTRKHEDVIHKIYKENASTDCFKNSQILSLRHTYTPISSIYMNPFQGLNPYLYSKSIFNLQVSQLQLFIINIKSLYLLLCISLFI